MSSTEKIIKKKKEVKKNKATRRVHKPKKGGLYIDGKKQNITEGKQDANNS